MKDTITESELTAMKNKFIADTKYPYATPDAMRYALKHVGVGSVVLAWVPALHHKPAPVSNTSSTQRVACRHPGRS